MDEVVNRPEIGLSLTLADDKFTAITGFPLGSVERFVVRGAVLGYFGACLTCRRIYCSEISLFILNESQKLDIPFWCSH